MILVDDDRTALAAAQAAIVAAQDKGDTETEKTATATRDELVVATHDRHRGTRGIVTEIAAALRIHRTTVHRILVAKVTGRAAYRPTPRRLKRVP